MTKQVIELKIEIEGIKPKIWRTFQVEASTTFNKLHKIIQKVMGWEDYHMYDFKVGKTNIVDSRDEDIGFLSLMEEGPKEIKANKAKLSDFIEKKSQKFSYMYDMGDSWEHILTVKKIFEAEDTENFPVVIDGERACPPEDCGGVWGYEEILEILKDPEHPEYEERIEEWLGEDFDPEYFNVDEVNKKFKKAKPKAKSKT
ncbi:MAG: plasmid pRiA4b ORF-3 family protein [Candidatus Gastranaerophilales bacterium]|nr:plasmid pRiA4b ORF-3 family protein [Candidatus Gastranaerophilales bacterium]